MNKIRTFGLIIMLLVSPHSIAFKTTVLVFGDSLSAAYNMSISDGWVALMEKNLNALGKQVEVRNASISGETTTGGISRFQKQLDLHNPDIVILELGANDGLRGTDLTTTRKNLTSMVEMSHKAGSHVVLAGIQIPPNYGRTYTKQFGQIFTDLAERENVSFIPFILDKVATIEALTQKDGLHPNEKAQPIIMRNVLPILVPLIK